MYGNDTLVQSAAGRYLEIKKPRDRRVLEAMRKVDRKDFLPDDLMTLYTADPEVLGALAKAVQQMTEPGKGHLTSGTGKPYRIALMALPHLLQSVKKYEVPV